MKKVAAFTLIEVLIVIVVFSIGILATFHGMTQTFRNESYADTQIKSAFFAREGIELMFNLRDANYHKEVPWNCIFNPYANADDVGITLDEENGEESVNPYCSGYFNTGMIIKIGMGSGNEYIHIETGTLSNDFSTNFSGYQIYYHTGYLSDGITGYYYNHTGTEAEKTRFARYIVITGVTENGVTLPTGNILKIESHVLYERMGTTGEKVMETFIGNYEF